MNKTVSDIAVPLFHKLNLRLFLNSGFLPVNAQDNILNLNYINSFILYSSTNRLSNGIHYK